MASPHSFIRIAEGDILYDPKNPWSFLPTSLKQHEGALMWTAPGYATYGTTPTNHRIQYSSCAVYCYKLEQTVILPPNLQKIHESRNIASFHKSYIAQFRNATATIEHYFKTNLPNDRSFENAIQEWKQTCDKLVDNPFFSDGWDLPAFYPFYTDESTKALEYFFDKNKEAAPDKSTLWERRHRSAREMHDAWRQLYQYVTSPNNIPFPKSLWYHKFFYIHKRNLPEVWKEYFDGTTFNDLANIE